MTSGGEGKAESWSWREEWRDGRGGKDSGGGEGQLKGREGRTGSWCWWEEWRDGEEMAWGRGRRRGGTTKSKGGER